VSHDQTIVVGGAIALAGLAFVTLPASHLVPADRLARASEARRRSFFGTQR